MDKVAQATCSIIMKHGIQGLSYSRLARSSGVSRSWLYKYIGNKKDDLIKFAADYYGRAFSRLEKPSYDYTTKKQWVEDRLETMDALLRDAVEFPWIVPLYFKYRFTENVLGKQIRDIETMVIKKASREIQKTFKVDKRSADFVSEMLVAFRMGVAYRWSTLQMHKRVPKSVVLKNIGRWIKLTSNVNK